MPAPITGIVRSQEGEEDSGGTGDLGEDLISFRDSLDDPMLRILWQRCIFRVILVRYILTQCCFIGDMLIRALTTANVQEDRKEQNESRKQDKVGLYRSFAEKCCK
jgi:hypothetical protein